MENWMQSFSLVKNKEVEQQQQTLDTETGNKFKVYIERDVQNITMTLQQQLTLFRFIA